MRWAKADGVWFAREQLEVANGGVLYDQATFSEGDLGPPAKRQAKVCLDAPHRRPCMPSLVPRVPASALTPALFSRGRAHHVVQQGGDAPVRGRGPAARHGRCRERVLLALIAASGASKPHPAAVHLTRAGVIGSIAAFTLSPLSSLRIATRPFAPSSSTTRLRAASGFGARRWREKAAVAAGLTLGADPAMDATPERQDAIRCRLAHHAEMQAAVAAATAAAAAGAPADHVIVITGRCAPTARTQCRPLPRTSAAPSSSSRRATRSQVFG